MNRTLRGLRNSVLCLAAAVVLAGCGGSAGGLEERSEGQVAGETFELPNERVAIARPGDDVMHPDSQTEWWYVHAVDPKGARAVVVSFFTAPLPGVGGFLYTDEGVVDWGAPTSIRPHSGPGATLQAGGVRFEEASGRWLVDQEALGYTVHLELTETQPGVTAGPLEFGTEEMYWTVPVATARADGWVVEPDGDRIDIRGWRGYHDHNWGAFTLESDQYAGWDWAAVHEEPASAHVFGGVNQLGGEFDGLLVTVKPDETTACAPKLDRSAWTSVEDFRLPQEVRASCGGEEVSFTVVRPYVARLTTHALSESLARSEVDGSVGFIEHLARLESGE